MNYKTRFQYGDFRDKKCVKINFYFFYYYYSKNRSVEIQLLTQILVHKNIAL